METEGLSLTSVRNPRGYPGQCPPVHTTTLLFHSSGVSILLGVRGILLITYGGGGAALGYRIVTQLEKAKGRDGLRSQSPCILPHHPPHPLAQDLALVREKEPG
jgi:hypothetical protein